MKISELWLHEWVKSSLSRDELCARLTMAGLEIESATSVAKPFSHVVVGKVLTVEKHPEADRLNLCEVDVGTGKPVSIVCGAKNVKAGLKVPAALEGAVLNNDLIIKTSQIRGVTSNGMLCSSSELGLAETSEGLLILPDDAPIGANIWDYLQLEDAVIDVSITPNRGDCLSVMGLANEISALTETKKTAPEILNIKPVNAEKIAVVIHASEQCPHYVGRIIRHVKADATTPIKIQERLRRSGQRCISPVVDVMNYVMLELGQPMHAFDLAKISGGIQVRMAKASEKLELLDGQTVTLTPDTLVIADDQQSLAMAGVMGGLDSAVTLLTKDIFLESAYFNPQCIAQTARKFNLGSESSYRFERSVDPSIQVLAIERATQLLLEIVGGEPGPIIDVVENKYLPQPKTIALRAARVDKMLGMKIPHSEIEVILTRLGFECVAAPDGWNVKVPTSRSDITIEVDLIEEVMRLYGADRVPLREAVYALRMMPELESRLPLTRIRNALCDAGYHEVITYTFVDDKLQALLDPESKPKALINPITSDMNVMRTNLWPGLVKTLMYNLNRQQNRVRIFETGLRFIPAPVLPADAGAHSELVLPAKAGIHKPVEYQGNVKQERVLSALVTGSAFPEQWGIPSRKVDFFDLKGDLQEILKLTFSSNEFTFKSETHPALHPGQTAAIYRQDQRVGIIGALHPTILQTLDIPNQIFVFEVLLDSIEPARVPASKEVSKFPEIRRDIAIFVDRSVPLQSIQDRIVISAGELLKEVNVFDVYQGKGVSETQKSVALSLTLQHSSRTLVDEEVADIMERVIGDLKDRFTAELRG